MRERDAALEKLKIVGTGSSDRTGQSDIEGSSVRRGEGILSGEQTVEQAYNELRDEYKVKLRGIHSISRPLGDFSLLHQQLLIDPCIGCSHPASATSSMLFLYAVDTISH